MAREVSRREDLVIVTPEPEAVYDFLKGQGDVHLERIHLLQIATNDTWARDHAFLTCVDEQGGKALLDFVFNGWGQKFAANLDNLINRKAFNELKHLLKPTTVTITAARRRPSNSSCPSSMLTESCGWTTVG